MHALATAGYPTVSTARHPEALADLAAAGCHTLALDVTDEGSMARAVRAVEEGYGGIAAPINNAGYGEMGPLEDVPIATFRRQLETNVVGVLRLCQLVMPGMRRQGYGRIVNVSTTGGVLAMLGGGAYYASKHALEALSDALRAEVAPFGIAVVVIQPGLVWSGFNATARASAALVPNSSPYDELKHALVTRAFGDAAGVPRALGATPEQVAKPWSISVQAPSAVPCPSHCAARPPGSAPAAGTCRLPAARA